MWCQGSVVSCSPQRILFTSVRLEIPWGLHLAIGYHVMSCVVQEDDGQVQGWQFRTFSATQSILWYRTKNPSKKVGCFVPHLSGMGFGPPEAT